MSRSTPGARSAPTAPSRPGAERIIFADHLRGPAALAVALSHLIGIYWAMPGLVAGVTFTPLPPGPLSGIYVFGDNPLLQLGPLGVAVFFLVSGFVIPISLREHTRSGFVVARLLRIYPTYIVALLAQMLLLYANATAWGKPFIYSAWDIAANCLLIENYVGIPSLDLVNWTLGVELKFYVAAALLARFILRGSLAAIGAVAIAALLLNAMVQALAASRFAGAHAGLMTAVSYDSLYVAYMLIGTLFHYHQRGLIRAGTLAASVVLLTLLFLWCWHISRIAAQFPLAPLNYLFALGLFAALYCVRRHVPANRALRAVAAISYPFYLVHVLVGFSVLKILLIVPHLPYWLALGITLIIVAAAAAALHFAIETPSIRLGKRLRIAATRRRPGTTIQSLTVS